MKKETKIYLIAGIGTFVIVNLAALLFSGFFREVIHSMSIIPLLFMVRDILNT